MHAGWRQADLRLLSLAFTAGVLIVHVLRELPSWPWLLLLSLLALYPQRHRAPLAMAVLGVLLTTFQAQRQLAERWPESRHNEERWVAGHIVSLPELREREGELTARFLFQPEDKTLPQRIRVSWYEDADAVAGGECWNLKLRLKTPHGSLNPGAFDYEAWLFRQGISATATVRSAQPCEIPAWMPVLKLRQQLGDQLRSWLPDHPAQALVVALVTGDDGGLTDQDWERFRRTGTSHLVAISGFNIAIIAGVAFFLGRWLWALIPPLCRRLPAQRAGVIVAALLSLGYALLAGFEPPVLRALLMLWTVLAAAWLHRLSQASRVLALAWLLILLADPLAITSPGLWLSFGAVAAMFYFSLNRLGTRPAWQVFLLMQTLLSVVLTPVSLFFFQGVSWSAPWINLLAVPLFIVLTPLLLAAVLLAWSLPPLGLPLLGLCAEVLQMGQQALALVAAWPQFWWAASPSWPVLAVGLFGAILLFVPRGVPLRPLALLCLLPLVLPPAKSDVTGLDITVLDVGQGLSVVLRTSQHTLLLDTGPAYDEGFDAGEAIVVPYLLSQGISKVDVLVVSHEDKDHSGGAAAVRRLMKVMEERGPYAQPCRDGESWDWEGVNFRFLHPDNAEWSRNNGGCVLRVQVGQRVLLLPADIEKRAEQRLVKTHAADLRADVLLAPHHGSKTSSTAAFVEAVQPSVVIHSAGWRHHFRHPHPAVVQRYRAVGAQQWTSGAMGALRFRLSEEGVADVQAYRNTHAKWWNAPPDPAGHWP